MPKRFSVICASNQNRSMAAHCILKENKFNVKSFGTGTAVRLPGPSQDKPNVYPFGKAYDEMYKDLESQDKELYTQNGLLKMLDRNRKVKVAPERFQESLEQFDVIITCEERVFDAVCEDILNREGDGTTSVHVINVEIRDNHEQAELGSKIILRLAHLIEASQDVDGEIQDILHKVESETRASLLHAVTFY